MEAVEGQSESASESGLDEAPRSRLGRHGPTGPTGPRTKGLWSGRAIGLCDIAVQRSCPAGARLTGMRRRSGFCGLGAEDEDVVEVRGDEGLDDHLGGGGEVLQFGVGGGDAGNAFVLGPDRPGPRRYPDRFPHAYWQSGHLGGLEVK